MAEPEILAEPEGNEAPVQEMELEAEAAAVADEVAAEDVADGGGCSKRAREEAVENEEDNEEVKKPKVEKSVEEERLEKKAGSESESGPLTVGPKSFGSSIDMYDYFFKLLHSWSPNINVNKYEHTMLLELIKKGHADPDKKIGKGISAFQVRFHPKFRSRCFFLTRDDESVDDFSFRKCVDQISPLPENMQVKHDVNKVLGKGRGGRSGGRGGGRFHGRGGGGKSRN